MIKFHNVEINLPNKMNPLFRNVGVVAKKGNDIAQLALFFPPCLWFMELRCS